MPFTRRRLLASAALLAVALLAACGGSTEVSTDDPRAAGIRASTMVRSASPDANAAMAVVCGAATDAARSMLYSTAGITVIATAGEGGPSGAPFSVAYPRPGGPSWYRCAWRRSEPMATAAYSVRLDVDHRPGQPGPTCQALGADQCSIDRVADVAVRVLRQKTSEGHEVLEAEGVGAGDVWFRVSISPTSYEGAPPQTFVLRFDADPYPSVRTFLASFAEGIRVGGDKEPDKPVAYQD